jgi:AcrR family transcriptional regulator
MSSTNVSDIWLRLGGMGNREDLLAGARKVIIERGVANATARDIAAAAGVSLAAIGYHFGSKERLLTAALTDAVGTAIGDGMGELIRDGASQPPLESFAHLWNGVPGIFAANRDAILASFENSLRIVRDPDAQQQMNAAITEALRGIAEDLRAAHPHLSVDQAQALAQLDFVLVQGLALLWLLSPDGDVPSGDRFADAITALTTPPTAE